MKDIRFRAWQQSKQKMWSWEELLTLPPEKFKDVLTGIWLNPIEQFTGLKDKNGVDIYEGDVVRFWTEYDNAEVVYETGTHVIRWVIDRWFPDGYDNGDYYRGDDVQWGPPNECQYDAARCEVSGNIHENPELLEGL